MLAHAKIQVSDTPISGVLKLKHRIFEDERGVFFEAYQEADFLSIGIKHGFSQDNQSVSKKGVIRGVHYQIEPHLQAKLVRCSHGRVFDVVVDLREGSPSFGKWFGVELCSKSGESLYVPEGVGHGFQVLEDFTVVSYKTSSLYAPDYEKGVHPFDPDLKIDWPIKQGVVLSQKDQSWPPLSVQFSS